MNKKNFKSEYDNYMKNIKPSADLIQKTLKLANEEQERLQKSKEKSSLKIICNLNFRKFTALACTLVFAIFAVKLWNDIDKQPIPVKEPNPVTETTTSITENDMTIDTTTISTDVQSSVGTLDDNTILNTDTLDTSIDVTSIDESVSNSSQSISTVYSNENIYTTIPYDDNNHYTSTIDTSTNNIVDGTSTCILGSNDISNPNNSTSSDGSTTTSINSTENIGTSSIIVTTTPTIATTITTTTITTTTHTHTTTTSSNGEGGNASNPVINITTSSSGGIGGDEGSSGSIESTTIPPTITTIPVTTTTGGTFTNTQQTTYVEENTLTECTTTGSEECVDSEPSITITADDTTMSEITQPVTTTEIPTVDISTRMYMAIRVTLINKQGGFYEDGTLYTNRIMDYLSYGSELTCVIPLGKTDNQDCDAILVFDYRNVFNQYSINYLGIVTDLNNGDYSKIELVENPTEDNRNEYMQFNILNKNLDLNENGIDIQTDIDDRNTYLDLLTIDDTPLS